MLCAQSRFPIFQSEQSPLEYKSAVNYHNYCTWIIVSDSIDSIKTIILPYSHVSIIRVVAVRFNMIRKEKQYLALADAK